MNTKICDDLSLNEIDYSMNNLHDIPLKFVSIDDNNDDQNSSIIFMIQTYIKISYNNLLDIYCLSTDSNDQLILTQCNQQDIKQIWKIDTKWTKE